MDSPPPGGEVALGHLPRGVLPPDHVGGRVDFMDGPPPGGEVALGHWPTGVLPPEVGEATLGVQAQGVLPPPPGKTAWQSPDSASPTGGAMPSCSVGESSAEASSDEDEDGLQKPLLGSGIWDAGLL